MPVAAASQGSQTWTPSRDEQDDLDDINTTLTRLRNALAPDPYVLTIPQDVEPRYHHMHRTWAEQWLTGTPFERGEHESLQYQTFFFHEHGKDMYVLQNSRSPADEPRMNASSRAKPATGANTPSAGPKKKISLDAYKKKQTGASGTPERDALKSGDAPAKQAALKGPVERVKAETEEMLAAIAEAEGELAPADEDKFQTKKKHLKREREEFVPKREQEQTSKALSTTNPPFAATEHVSSEPPVKKPKTGPTNSVSRGSAKNSSIPAAQQAMEKKSQAQELVDTGMPPRLSPGMPPRLSPGLPEKLSPLEKVEVSISRKQAVTSETDGWHVLPQRLSPTIPDNVARLLETRTNSQSTPQQFDPSSAPGSVVKSKQDRLTPIKKTETISKRKSPVPVNGFRATSSSPAVRSDTEDKPLPAPAIPKSNPSVSAQEGSITISQPSIANEAQKNGRESLTIKLRYKRARKEAVQRILKLPPKPAKRQPTLSQPLEESKPPTEKRNGERKENGPVKGVAQKIGPVKKEKKTKVTEEGKLAIAEKRSMPEDDKFESPAKRKKPSAPEPRKEPATPAQREIDSPLASKSAQQVTPGQRKDFLSVAMRREQSQDSVATHNTPPDLSSTPMINNSSSQVNGVNRPPPSQPCNPTPRQQAWEAEQRRLETLGRELKHAASAHLNTSQQDSSKKLAEQRLAAVKCLESFICYLVAFTCADEAAAAAEPRQPPAYRTWRSLNGFFAFVKKTTEPFGPLWGLACTLGMAFSSRILAIATQFPGDGPGRNELLDTQAQMQRAVADAETKLDVDVLQDTFPKLWKARTKTTLPNLEKLEPTKLGGQYKLPINIATPPIRAARAGHAMLHEWMEKQKVDYTMKLKL